MARKRPVRMIAGCVCLVFFGTCCHGSDVHAPPTRLDVNDVSWLWPVPASIAASTPIDRVLGADGTPAWPKKDFDDVIAGESE